MKTCNTKDCEKIVLAKGLCTKCYYRVKRGGTPEVSKKQQMALRLCSIPGCIKSHFAEDLCDMHYRRKERHGNPLYINPKCNRDGNYKQRARIKTAQWKKDNKESYNAYLASRKARVRQATPKWADLKAIREMYYNCPKDHHVDHIIPINGNIVSGLHTLSNLQYLPALENLRKSNKYHK